MIVWFSSRGEDISDLAEIPPARQSEGTYAGSTICRQCHEEFYRRRASSFHGLAMQPFSVLFAKAHLTIIDGYIGRFFRFTFDDNHVVAGHLHLGGEVTSGEGHADGAR